MSIVSVRNDTLGRVSVINAFAPLAPTISSYNILVSGVIVDDTAVDTAGAQTIQINGTGFAPGAVVTLGGSPVTTAYVSPNTITFTAPAKTAGSYAIYVVNLDGGTAIYIPGIVYSGTPAWTTASGSLGSIYETNSISTTALVTTGGDAPIVYSLASGALPTGSSLNTGTGVITGTAPVDSGSTVYSFTIKATDAQLQDSLQNFTLTINTDTVTWSSPAAASTVTLPQNAASTTTLLATSAAGKAITYTSTALPAGLSISGATVTGTPTEVATTAVTFTATAATTNKTATAVINWTVSVAADTYFQNTTLLLSGAAATETFIADASTNNFALTIAGDTKPNNFNPYTPGYYSNYFDGTGDYLSVAANAALVFGTGDFTVELWFYIPGGITSPLAIIGNGTGSIDSAYWSLEGVAGGNIAFFGPNSATQYFATTTQPWTSGWAHIAVSRAGANTKLFLNGVQQGSTYTTNNSFVSGGNLYIGTSSYTPGSRMMPAGYISNVRIVKGVAVYTGNFAVPTAPLTATQSSGTNISAITGTATSLLTCQSNRFIDNSTNAFVVTKSGDTKVSPTTPFVPNTAYAAYGSTYFDGTGDYLRVPYNAGFAMGSSNFTIEYWVYPTVLTGDISVLGSHTSDANGGYGVGFDGTTPRTWITFGSGGWLQVTGPSALLNAWNHIALVRNGSSFYMYTNGVPGTVYTNAAALVNASNSDVTIGARYNGTANFYTGYVTDARIIKGTAVYTSAFTPPSAPLTAITNTSLLTLQTNQPASNSMFLDSSTNAFAVTRAGNTSAGTFNPYGANWSNYFNGSSYMVPATGINAAMGAGFAGNIISFEMWIFPTTFTNGADGNGIMGAYGAVSVNGRWIVSMERSATTTAKLQMAYTISTGSQVNIESTASAITLNQWNHIAITVDATTAASSTIKLFANGVLLNTFTGQNMSTQTAYYRPVYIGDVQSQYVSAMVGYISNFRILKGAFAYTGNYTVPTARLTATANTVLLTCQSNSSVDNSANAFALSLTGPPTVQRFSPFAPQTQTANTHSTYFDGSTDWITLPSSSSAYNLTGDFTVEAWVYATAQAGADWGIIDARVSGATPAAWLVLLAPSGAGHTVRFYNAGPNNGTTVIPLNTWAHIAVVRSGTALRTFVNGVQDLNNTTYGSGPISPGTTSPRLGTSKDASGTNYMTKGYISNLRLVNGVAVYTGAFTPPTAPLTATQSSGTNIAAITGTATSLLTFQSPTLIDASTNAFVLTPTTTTIKPRTLNPFGFTNTSAAYSAAVYGGSAYFDGTGDYLTAPYTSSYNIALNTAFTFECWVYTSSTSLLVVASRNWGYGGGGPTWSFFLSSGITPNWGIAGTGQATYSMMTSSISGVLNQWNHYVWTRNSSNVCSIYVNGVSGTTRTDGQAMTSGSGDVFIGVSTNLASPYATGYMSNMRFVSGTAVYTSNFVPPTAPLSAITNTSLLLNMTSAGVYDSASINNLETVADAKLVATQTPYAGSYYSNYFDGSGDYLTVPQNAAYNFGTGDFTVEGWYYLTAIVTDQALLMLGTGANGAGPIHCGWWLKYSNSGALIFYRYDGTETTYTFSTTLVVNTWYHIACSRSGTSLRMFLNGAQVGATATSSLSFNNVNSDPLQIGKCITGQGTFYYNGYVSNVRIVKGVAVYTAAFTVPTAPLTATQAGNGATISAISGTATSLLTCQSNRFVDNSTNLFAITKYDNTRVQSFNPFQRNSAATLYLDGTGDWLFGSPSVQNQLTGNFTIECWAYPTTLGSQMGIVTITATSSSGTNGLAIYFDTSNKISFWVNGNGGTVVTTTAYTANQWYHIALVRNGTTNTLYVNGVSSASNSVTPTWPTTPAIGIGRIYNDNSLYAMTGYINDLRITKGVARYTTTFTPPTTAFIAK